MFQSGNPAPKSILEIDQELHGPDELKNHIMETCMSYKDILLALSIYPDPTPNYIIEQAASMARGLSAKLTALVPSIDRASFAAAYPRRRWPVDPSQIIDTAIAEANRASKQLLDQLTVQTKANGISSETVFEPSGTYPEAETIVQHARVHDLALLPVPELIGLDELFHEAVIFGSGSPVILLPAKAGGPSTSGAIDDVIVLWDFSRAAARAIADAMPILEKARNVRVVTFLNEKRFDRTVKFDNLQKHLEIHAVNASFSAIDISGRPIGDAIRKCISAPTNLLVMGAFGHSRMLEFILGGATRSALNDPPIPVFMSH